MIGLTIEQCHLIIRIFGEYNPFYRTSRDDQVRIHNETRGGLLNLT